ncbi:MAG: protein kinase [Gemmatimonadetes bacterium]|nr:protein kinase [Gemmatimonadota bacterium]
MSRVFLAEENSLGRRVVVKVLSPELAEGLSSERFTREVRLAARLQHPNVVPVLTAGQLASLPYYTMPFIDGASLRERLVAGPLALAEAVTVLRDVARALAYAHVNGIVHRDIKPENVLLTGGAAVVADFGIAKAIAESAGASGSAGTLTALGMAIGTPAYMAPEQAAGDPDTDHRADLYAWGLLAWESLVGRHPFSDRLTAMALIGAHMTRIPEPVATLRSEVPTSLSSLIARCLAKDPADRPTDARELLVALDGVMMTPAEPIPASAPAQTPSIAVLPFANVSGNAEDEYFSDGMTEEVISELSRLRGIRVAARTSSFAFKGTRTDMRTIAEQLGVRTILEGSVRRSGSRVRIAVQLVSAADGLNLWSDRYDREIADIFTLQDDIARAITGALEIHLTPNAPRGTVDPAAYDLLLRGRFLFFQYQAVQALACFERAAEIDPSFVLAHAWIGFASILGANIHLLPAERGYARGRAAGERVRALDPSLAEGMVLGAAVALWFDWDRKKGESLARQAVRAAPALSIAYEFLGWSLIVGEQFDAGIAAFEEGYALDPLSDFMLCHLIVAHSYAGRDARAIEVAQGGIARSPGSSPLHHLLGVALLGAGRMHEARDALLRANELSPGMAQLPSALACALAATGDREGAMRSAAELEVAARLGKVSLTEVACAHLWLGDEETAFSWLERDLAGRANWGTSSWVHIDPRFRRLRGHPRFEAILRQIGFVNAPLVTPG